MSTILSTDITESTSPEQSEEEEVSTDLNGDTIVTGEVSKKKKKRKTNAQKREALQRTALAAVQESLPPPIVIKISRNKHMKYISSFHGPWLSLPHEILDSLLQVNCNPEVQPVTRSLLGVKSLSLSNSSSRYKSISSAHHQYTNGFDDEILPPPIDPSVFRGILKIRQLVDDASDLAVRAASCLSAAALGALNISNGFGNSSGMENVGGGRNPTMMSPIRQQRLRALAVTKLAEAYKIDEIAASVAVMGGSTSLENIAFRVLKYEPNNSDAKYVNFFHEKIPSRTLAISTDTTVLDNLIASNPTRLEYYRTRGIVLGFKGDYPTAIENYTQAIAQAKASRKAGQYHDTGLKANSKNSRKKGKSSTLKGEPKDSSTSTSVKEDTDTNIGSEAGDDLERQIMFHRGMAQHHFACKLIEDTILEIEAVDKPLGGLSTEGGEATLRNVGIILKDETVGLYGSASPAKQNQYRTQLSKSEIKDQVIILLRKSSRDLERFLAYFSIWEVPTSSEQEKQQLPSKHTDKPLLFRGRRLIHHRSLSGRTSDSDPRRQPTESFNDSTPTSSALLTTYHPLIIEAHFSLLLNLLLLGDFVALAIQHDRTVKLMDSLEAYPIFLPARSLNHSQYAELVERLAMTYLVARESNGFIEATLEEGDLKSLHHLLYFFTAEFVEVLATRAEESAAAFASRNSKEDGKLKANVENLSSKLIENGSTRQSSKDTGRKSDWAQEREKAEAERRKIDPSYCTFNTARAEMALAWLLAVILPEKELEEKKVVEAKVALGKGKGPEASYKHNSRAGGSSSSRGMGIGSFSNL